MIKFPIPFSMGTYGESDPMTFEFKIDHPFLDIGSTYSSVKDEIKEWLDSNLGKKWKCEWSNNEGGWVMFFESEEDMTLFLLRWS